MTVLGSKKTTMLKLATTLILVATTLGCNHFPTATLPPLAQGGKQQGIDNANLGIQLPAADTTENLPGQEKQPQIRAQSPDPSNLPAPAGSYQRYPMSPSGQPLSNAVQPQGSAAYRPPTFVNQPIIPQVPSYASNTNRPLVPAGRSSFAQPPQNQNALPANPPQGFAPPQHLPPPNVTGPPPSPPQGAPPYATPFRRPVLPPATPPTTLPGLGPVPSMTADVDVLLEETQTGRFMFGVGVNSDAGLIGNIVVDERNFDVFRYPRSWQDFREGRAFRGGGQGFRLEALPGTLVQRYSLSLSDPYLLGTRVSFNISGFFFNRLFYDWDEQRLGGRIGLGYRLTPDLSVNATLRAENVNVHNLRVSVPELEEVKGDNDVFGARFGISHDTRDIPFSPTEGHLVKFGFEQVFGSFDFGRGDMDLRQYVRLRERPDGSGHHVLGATLRVGISGTDTPVFENYFAGGFSTIRGFDFRGASPRNSGVIVGGEFQLLGSVEYMFPLTADDMVRGVVFCDYGTVEEEIEIHKEDFRVSPGFGLRVFVPALGPAPLAFDFAFPVAREDTDDIENFSFFIGFGR